MLRERTKALILNGAKITGSMVEGYHYVAENLYVHEAQEIYDFCKWIDTNVGGCSEYNIDRLYACWKNPTKENNEFVADLCEKIKHFRSL